MTVVALHAVGGPALATGGPISGMSHAGLALAHGDQSQGHSALVARGGNCGHEDAPNSHPDDLCVALPRQTSEIDGLVPSPTQPDWLSDSDRAVAAALPPLPEQQWRGPSLYGSRVLGLICVLRV